jgi:hypothetical protein
MVGMAVFIWCTYAFIASHTQMRSSTIFPVIAFSVVLSVFLFNNRMNIPYWSTNERPFDSIFIRQVALRFRLVVLQMSLLSFKLRKERLLTDTHR